MGSRTVFGALTTQFTMMHSIPLALILISTWALAPIGGQAASRLMFIGSRTSYDQTVDLQHTYFDTRSQAQFVGWDPISQAAINAYGSLNAVLNSLYTAALLSTDAVKLGPMDVWGNVKVPFIQPFPSGDDWFRLGPRPTFEYSSLVGVPLGNDLHPGNSSFSMEAAYIELDCGRPFQVSRYPDDKAAPKFITLNSTLFSDLRTIATRTMIPNGTFQGLNGNSNTSVTWSLGLDTFVDHLWYEKPEQIPDSSNPGSSFTAWHSVGTYDERDTILRPEILANQSGIVANRATLLFQSHDVIAQMYTGPNITYTTTKCSVVQRYVENMVNCTLGSGIRDCRVTAQRRSRVPYANPNITQLSWPQVFRYISLNQPLATGQTGGGGVSDISLYYINNTHTDQVIRTDAYAHLVNVDPSLFSQRLGQLINSYILLGQAYTAVISPQGPYFQNNRTSEVTVITTQPIYVVSWIWILLLSVAIAVMLAAAVASVIFQRAALGPDILGYCSLSVRDSKYIDLPQGLGPLDGRDISKRLRGQEFRFGVVSQTKDGTGVLGTGVALEVEKMRKGERYL